MSLPGRMVLAVAAGLFLSLSAVPAQEVRVPAAAVRVQSAQAAPEDQKPSGTVKSAGTAAQAKGTASQGKKQVSGGSAAGQSKASRSRQQPARAARQAGGASRPAPAARPVSQAAEKHTRNQATPEQIASCYRSAKTPKDRQDCLRKEHSAVTADYNAVINEVLLAAQRLDRNSADKQHAKAFTASNRAYEQYVKAECESLKHFRGSGIEGENARLACRINMMRLRGGSLESEFMVSEIR